MSTITSTSSTQLPEWYNQYAQNLIGRGLSVTSEPYQAYGAPRVAGFTPDQQAAFQMTRQSVGAWQPYVQQGAQSITQAGQGSAAGRAQPYLQQGIGSFTNNVNAYMSPYINNVVDRVGTLAARNLSENLLPAVNRTFVGGGTFGGSRSADFTARAVRDANESALAQQGQLLNQGYGQAADIYNTEANRALQAGSIAGNLGVSDLYRQLQAGQSIAGLGNAVQGASATDAANLAAVGQQQQNLAQNSANLAYQDFQQQRDYPWTQVERLRSLGQGISLPNTTTSTQPGPNSTAQDIGAITSGLGALAKIFGI